MLRRITNGAAARLHMARAVLDRLYSRRSHLVVETADGREGFALFGGFRARIYFRALYLPARGRTRTRLAIHHPLTADECRGLAARFGLVVFCGDAAPAGLAADLLTIPVSVDMEMPAPAALEGPGAPWTRSAKANIARVKRSGFTCDVVTGDRWVREFHRRMFRPAIRGRHGDRAAVLSRRRLTRLARGDGAELLRIVRDGQWVAGDLTQSTADGYRLLKLGWLDGDEALLKAGVASAAYWFSIQRAVALGHRRIHLGSVDPYLEDGVLRYKSYWGARIAADSRHFSEFRLLLDPSHAACLRFLTSHSFVTRGANRDLIVFSGHAPGAGGEMPELLSSIARWYIWRDAPTAAPEVTSTDVPGALRPWVTLASTADR